MQVRPILMATALFLIPAVTALAQRSTTPDIGADNTNEASQIRAGHAVTPPNDRDHDQMNHNTAGNAGSAASDNQH